MDKKDKIITIRLTDTVWSDLKALSEYEEVSMSDILRDLLSERLGKAKLTLI